MEKPTMHAHEELEKDLEHHTFISDEILLKWFHDRYSTSKHLLTLYSLATGVKPGNILEIGFGRSSFLLARVAKEQEAHFFSCDTRDFSYLLSEEEKSVTSFIHGYSDEVWKNPKIISDGIDFAFLDYFSGVEVSERFIKTEIKKCLQFIKTNGLIAIHDSIDPRYNVQKALKSLVRWRRDLEYVSLPYNYGLGILKYTGKSKYGVVEDHWKKK